MKKTIIALLMMVSFNTMAQTTSSYTSITICSQEFLEFNKTKDLYQIKSEGACIGCKIMYNDYYIRVFENDKEIFTIDKGNYYKSSENDGTTFYRNKYNNYYMQLEKNGRWIGFGKTSEYKFIYNVCDTH
jgi:adenylate cyclase